MLCHHCGTTLNSRICPCCGAKARLRISLDTSISPRDRLCLPLLLLLIASLVFMGVVDVSMLGSAEGFLWHTLIAGHLALLAIVLVCLVTMTLRRR